MSISVLQTRAIVPIPPQSSIMMGPLTVPPPITDSNPATKLYVDQSAGGTATPFVGTATVPYITAPFAIGGYYTKVGKLVTVSINLSGCQGIQENIAFSPVTITVPGIVTNNMGEAPFGSSTVMLYQAGGGADPYLTQLVFRGTGLTSDIVGRSIYYLEETALPAAPFSVIRVLPAASPGDTISINGTASFTFISPDP